MSGRPHPADTVAVPGPAVAFLAYQLADRWGNRRTPRPSPRSDVLAALLAQGTFGTHPGGVPALDGPSPAPADANEIAAAWSEAVVRAAAIGPYVAYLVSGHLSDLAQETGPAGLTGFLDEQEARRRDMRRRLDEDPRYRQTFLTGADEANRLIMKACHTLALHLVRHVDHPTAIPIPTAGGNAAASMLRPAGHRSYRLSPWPFLGRRLAVSVHGYDPAEPGGGNGKAAWPDGAAHRLRWILISPGAPR